MTDYGVERCCRTCAHRDEAGHEDECIECNIVATLPFYEQLPGIVQAAERAERRGWDAGVEAAAALAVERGAYQRDLARSADAAAIGLNYARNYAAARLDALVDTLCALKKGGE